MCTFQQVLSSKTSVLGQFERRVISDDISTSTISQVDDILSELTQDRFTLEKFKTIWLSQVNVNTSKNMIKVIKNMKNLIAFYGKFFFYMFVDPLNFDGIVESANKISLQESKQSSLIFFRQKGHNVK